MIIPNTILPTADVATTGTALGWNFTASGNDGVGTTYQNGTSGNVTIDGITLAVGMIVLVKDESSLNLKRNGLYLVAQAGPSTNCTLVRHPNMSNSASFNYTIVPVTQGTQNANTLWMFQYVPSFVVDGGTSSSYVQFASLGVAGMNKTIQQLSIVSGYLQWDVSKGYNAYYTPAAGSSYTIKFLSLPATNIGVYGTLVITQPPSSGYSAANVIVPQSSPGTGIIVGGGTPTGITTGQILLSTTPSAIDIISFYYDGTYTYWTYAPNFKS